MAARQWRANCFKQGSYSPIRAAVGTPIGGFPADPTFQLSGNTYQFVFWNASNGLNAVDGYPSTAEKLVLPNLSGVFQATAWYAMPGGDGHGPPGLRARTFDGDVNLLRRYLENVEKEHRVIFEAISAIWPPALYPIKMGRLTSRPLILATSDSV